MTELTTKQTKAVIALLTNRTLTEAAAVANISPRQLYRWLELPEFIAALRVIESQVLGEATRRLLTGMGEALDTLHDLMTSAQVDSFSAVFLRFSLVETFTRAQVDKIPGAFEIHFNYAKFIGQQKSE